MKRILILMSLLVLVGCHLQVNKSDEPAHLVKLMEDENMTTYLSAMPVSLYLEEIHLRQFYIVNNFKEESVVDSENNLLAGSSRTVSVIDCRKEQWAVLERVYFSERYAQGERVFTEKYVTEWKPFASDSILNTVHGFICSIDSSELDPVPEDED